MNAREAAERQYDTELEQAKIEAFMAGAAFANHAAAALVEQAISEIDKIVEAKPLKYADHDDGLRMLHERRKFTMKDAKGKARHAAEYLRQAWAILDPSI